MTSASKTKTKIQAFVTAILGLFAMYLIISEPGNSDKIKWAYSIIGIIIGYWLK